MAALGAVLCFGGMAQADGFDVGPMHIGEVWARTTPKGASSAAAYLTVTNGGTTPDRISCVSSDAAEQCQIHTMTMESDVMKMRPVEGGLEIRPGESVTLKPGADHLMLTKLKHPLETGSSIQATLQFEKAGTVKIDVPVLAMGAAAPGTGGGGGSMMMQGNDHMMMQPGKK